MGIRCWFGHTWERTGKPVFENMYSIKDEPLKLSDDYWKCDRCDKTKEAPHFE